MKGAHYDMQNGNEYNNKKAVWENLEEKISAVGKKEVNLLVKSKAVSEVDRDNGLRLSVPMHTQSAPGTTRMTCFIFKMIQNHTNT